MNIWILLNAHKTDQMDPCLIESQVPKRVRESEHGINMNLISIRKINAKIKKNVLC